MTQSPNRREFLKTAGLTTLGLTVLPNLITRAAPSDRVRIAHIGLGGMGNNHMKWFADLPEAEIVALCDVDELHLGETKQRLEAMKPGTKVDTYGDFRRILEREDIATVPITNPRSPGHQQNFIDCVKSRKQPESNLAYAREMTIPMHLGLISYRLKRELTWNARKEKFTGDREANRLLVRKPRKGWDLT